jgi:diamine N-acetyltransferase
MIKLSEVTERDWQAVSALSVADGQIKFVAYNSYSLAQACYEPRSTAFSIYRNQEVIGFALIQERQEEVWILRLMIDQRYQGNGYGRDALNQICRLFPSRRLVTSYVPENIVAARLYESVGFSPTGVIDDGELVMHREPNKSRHGTA